MNLAIGTALALESSQSLMTCAYAPADSGTGALTLHLEDQTANLRLDPWSPDGYDVYEGFSRRCLVISGAGRIVVLERATLQVRGALWLDHGEAETIDRPWFAESDDGRFLIIATERHVWCVDDRCAVRWCWSVSSLSETRFVCAAPQLVGRAVRVPLTSFHGDSVVILDVDDAHERAR